MSNRVAILPDIHKFYISAAMNDSTGAGRVGISRNNDFITGADTQNTQVQFFCCRGGIKAYYTVGISFDTFFCITVNIRFSGFNIGRQPAFQQLGTGTGGNPATAQ